MFENPEASLKRENTDSISLIEKFVFLLIIQVPYIQVLLPFKEANLIMVAGISLLAILKGYSIHVPNRIVILFLVYAFLGITQGIYFGKFSIITLFYSFGYVFFVPYLLYKMYNFKAVQYIEEVLFTLTIISLILWCCQQWLPGFKSLIVQVIEIVNAKNTKDVHRSMYIYTYWQMLDTDYGISRNSGFAFEPATFCVFLIYGMVVNESSRKGLYKMKRLVYILALISSLSTTGYLALIVFIFGMMVQKKSFGITFILIPFFIGFTYFAYTSIDFLDKKIAQQYDEAAEYDLNSPTNGRFMGIRKSIYVLMKYPYFGRGLQAITRPLDPADPEYADYGIIAVLSKFGLVIGIIYFIIFVFGLFRFFSFFDIGIQTKTLYVLSMLITLIAQPGSYEVHFMFFFIIGWLMIPVYYRLNSV